MNETSVVIVAGGLGQRMLSQCPKQFLMLAHQPVLMHTMEAFYRYDPNIHIVVVLPEAHFQRWQDLLHHHAFRVKHQVVCGGQTRGESVWNGLHALAHEGWVAIHDGARPLVPPQLIAQAFQTAQREGNAVPAIPCTDSIRKIDPSGGSRSVNRDDYCAIQTPQVFRVSTLKRAYSTQTSGSFTDDASAMESHGEKIHLMEGSNENIKITTPKDLLLAKALLTARAD